MAAIRTFICFELSQEIKEKLATLQNQLKSLGQGVSWTRPAGMHLTLKFLGDVAEEKIGKVTEAVQRAAKDIRAFDVSVAGTGSFPNFKRPRVLWVGIQEPTGSLHRLQKNIELELEGLGFEREKRSFSPHLTLGRFKFAGKINAIAEALQDYGFSEQRFKADTIIVMKSDLKPDGATYTQLKRIELNQ